MTGRSSGDFDGEPATELDGGFELGGLCPADAVLVHELFQRSAVEPGQASEAFEQALTHFDRVLAVDPDAEQDGDELGIGEGLGAQGSEPFPRAVGLVEVGDTVSGAGVVLGHAFPSVKGCTHFTTKSLLDTPLPLK